MDSIKAESRTIYSVLSNKFTIDYYQRDFQWKTKQITELLDDLISAFTLNHSEGDLRENVEKYKHYFLGSITLSQSNGSLFIIDGQQRLTSITLLLIYIYHSIEDDNQRSKISNLIFSEKFSKLNFNIDVHSDPKRMDCMKELFDSGKMLDYEEQSKSVKNILLCYQEVEQVFSDKVVEKILPLFADWLMERVYLVEIIISSKLDDAYPIFETMNDRGLSLTPTDMLKGYLFSKIGSEQQEEVNKIWQERITSLHQIGKDEEANAIKSWLRSRYAKTIKDFNEIGSGFHRWVYEERDIELDSESRFVEFIKRDLNFYTEWYKNIRQYADNYSEYFDAIYFNNQNNFTLQSPVLLSALVPSDSKEDIYQKLKLISQYLDILIYRYIWNQKSIAERSMRDQMVRLIREIRQISTIQELSNYLCKNLENDEAKFTSNRIFGLARNRKQIRGLLARMTHYIEVKSGNESHYTKYIGHEIEHIWANHFDLHKDEFDHEADFTEYRNRIGGLLLLPKRINASLGDMIYEEKYEHYVKRHNLLAASLHEKTYVCEPGFLKFIKDSGLKFQAHHEFKIRDLELRQELYLNLAEMIWNPKILEI